jgi:replicative DNA helicase
VPSGLIDLDNVTGGFQDSDLILIAGRPGAGKSSLTSCMILNAALRYSKQIAFFSLEMPKDSIIARMICSEANLSYKDLRSGRLNHDQWAAFMHTREVIDMSGIYIDDTPAITVGELRAKALRWISEHDEELDEIVIDYLQLLTGRKGKRQESRQQEVAEISRDLKALAKELNIPLVVLSGLSRASEQRADKRPQLSDLRESGSLEMEADLVAFIFREALGKRPQDVPEAIRHLAELNLAKHRNGATETIMLRFEGTSMKFQSLSQQDREGRF